MYCLPTEVLSNIFTPCYVSYVRSDFHYTDTADTKAADGLHA
jgi:hypothetical protein